MSEDYLFQQIELDETCVKLSYQCGCNRNKDWIGLSLEDLKKIGWDEHEEAFGVAVTAWNHLANFQEEDLLKFHSLGVKAIKANKKDYDASENLFALSNESGFSNFTKKVNALDSLLKDTNIEEADISFLRLIVYATMIQESLNLLKTEKNIEEAKSKFYQIIPNMSDLLFTFKLKDLKKQWLEKNSLEFGNFKKLDSKLKDFDWDDSSENKSFYSISYLIIRLILSSKG
jgi:hypothetical protein